MSDELQGATVAFLPGYVKPSVPNRVAHRARCDVLIVATDRTAA